MNAAALLLEITVKSSLLLGLVLAIVSAVRKFSAEERHLIWVLAIFGLLLLPMVSILVPRWDTKLDPLPAYSRLVGSSVALQQATEVPRRQDDSIQRREARTTDPLPIPARIGARASLTSALPYLAPAYLLFAALFAAHFLFQRRRISRHVGTLSAVRSQQVLERVNSAKLTSKVSRAVRVLESSSDYSPWTWGIFRPVVVLPQGFGGWPEQDQDHVLLHELAHIGRLDHVVTALVQACCTLYWFNPLVWLAARRIRHEAESACDDRVLLNGATGSAYAQRLLAIATEISGRDASSVWIPAMANRSTLSFRINSILNENLRRAVVNRTKIVIASFAALGLIVPLGALQSQESARNAAVAELSDPAFQALVQAGPTTSEQLETIVTTYAANDLKSEAIQTFVQYLTREDREQDPDCWYCISLLWTEGTPRESAQLDLLTHAMEQLVTRAYEAGSGDNLVPLALMAVTSKNRAAMARGIYHMSVAIQFGVDQRWNIAVVRFLHEMGRNEDARELATSLHEDESSMYYQSTEVKQWIAYLNNEIARNDMIASKLASFDHNSSPEAHDYVPISKAAPKYPSDALETGLEGYVIVEFTVTASGRTAHNRVVMSSDAVFEQAALDAAKQFLYLPRVAAGTALDVPGVRNKITFVSPSN